jgi:hypothetical protein
LAGTSASGSTGVSIATGTPGIGGIGIIPVVSIAVITSVSVSGSIEGVSKSVSKPKKGIVKTQSPIGSIKTAVEERAVPPKGVVKGIIEAPIEIKISPRVVVDVINLCFTGAISPWGLGIDLNIAITIITAVVVSMSEGVVLGIVQGGVIIGDVGEIIFVVDPVVIGFGLYGFSDSHFASINTI